MAQLEPSFNPTLTQSIDVLIIGAGPVGLTAALWFGQQRYRVVVVEQYLEKARSDKRAFNERHQQVGLNPITLDFLEKLNPLVVYEIRKRGCPHNDWINISIFCLQNILHEEIKQLSNVKILFGSRLESVSTPKPAAKARVIVAQDNKKSSQDLYTTRGYLMDSCLIHSFGPELVVICDGRHDGTGVAKNFFGFPPASRVTLSSLGVIGLISRLDDNPLPQDSNTTCLDNYSSDCFMTSIGPMHVRLLGSIQERYIALGAADDHVKEALAKLQPKEIADLLKTAYLQLKDSREPEFTKFTEVSKVPIQIVLDYRKETIKLLEGSNTIVTVEGDAARKTTFFSGSGLNSGYRGLEKLFSFCQNHRHLIFDNPNLLDIDQILLEKDRDSLEVSLELLKKGIKFILTPQHLSNCTLHQNT